MHQQAKVSMEASGSFAKFVDQPFSTLAFTSEDGGSMQLDAPTSTKPNQTSQLNDKDIHATFTYVVLIIKC